MTGIAVSELGAVASLMSGGTPSKGNPDFWGGSIPWLTPKDMTDFDGLTQDKVSQAAIGNGTKVAPPGAIFIAVRGMSLHTEIRIIRSADPMAFNQDIKAIVPKGIDGDFLYFALTAHKPTLLELVEAAGHGTGVLPTDRLVSVPINRFGSADECKIGALFRALEDKIKLNRRMNETLEAVARAIYRDWFVDFGPTRDKMEKRPPYLAPEIWSLFPERLDHEKKPEGWAKSTFDAEFRLTMGQSPPGDTYNEEGVGLPFFQGRTDFGVRYPTRRMFCRAPTRVAEAEDTLVSVRAPVGDLNMAWEQCCIGRGVAAVRHKSGFRGYTYYALDALRPELEAFEHTGTVFGAINKAQFQALNVIAASTEAIEAYERLVSNIDDRIRANEDETTSLIATRDLLLPKLMSGEIRVKDAEGAK